MNERSRCVLVALVLLGTTDAFANLVSNPSFENFTGTFGGDGGRQLTSASTTLTDWNIAGGEIAVLRTSNSYHLAPSQGDNFLDLAGYSNTGFPKGNYPESEWPRSWTNLCVGPGPRNSQRRLYRPRQ